MRALLTLLPKRPLEQSPPGPTDTRCVLSTRSPPFLIPDVERLAQRERVRHDPHFSVGARRDGPGQGGFGGQDDAGRRGLPPPGKILRGVTCYKVSSLSSPLCDGRWLGVEDACAELRPGTTDAFLPHPPLLLSLALTVRNVRT